MMNGAGAAAAAAAARKRRLEQEREEEQETAPMTSDDGYEYKIIRTAWGTFKNSTRLRSVLDYEAQAGWDLFEKLDDRRVRLRRPITCREQDAELAQDAYRVWIGPSENAIGFLVAGSVMVVMVIIMFVIAVAR